MVAHMEFAEITVPIGTESLTKGPLYFFVHLNKSRTRS